MGENFVPEGMTYVQWKHERSAEVRSCFNMIVREVKEELCRTRSGRNSHDLIAARWAKACGLTPAEPIPLKTLPDDWEQPPDVGPEYKPEVSEAALSNADAPRRGRRAMRA